MLFRKIGNSNCRNEAKLANISHILMHFYNLSDPVETPT